MADETNPNAVSVIELATELTIAWLNNPNVKTSAEEVPDFLKTMHATIDALSSGADKAADAQAEHKPAVPVRSSVKPDYIISLIDGRKLKSLKRHLSMHGLTPKDYRERFGLKADYPMVAPNYSEQRRAVAKKLGLGRKPGKASAAPVPATATASAPAPVKAAPVKAAPKAKAPKLKATPEPKPAAAPKPVAAKPVEAPKPATAAAPKPKVAAKAKAAPKAKAVTAAPTPVKTPGKPGRPKKVVAPAS